MYKDHKSTWTRILILLLIVLGCAAGFFALRFRASADVSEESASAIKRAVEQSALQCYVVEGAYPPDLAYLQENYGLRVNTDAYYIVYEAYAQNQLPSVRVVARK